MCYPTLLTYRLPLPFPKQLRQGIAAAGGASAAAAAAGGGGGGGGGGTGYDSDEEVYATANAIDAAMGGGDYDEDGNHLVGEVLRLCCRSAWCTEVLCTLHAAFG